MTEPREDDDQHDEGGHGGMATRELDARQEADAPEDGAPGDRAPEDDRAR